MEFSLPLPPNTGCKVLDSWITPVTVSEYIIIEPTLREGKINIKFHSYRMMDGRMMSPQTHGVLTDKNALEASTSDYNFIFLFVSKHGCQLPQ